MRTEYAERDTRTTESQDRANMNRWRRMDLVAWGFLDIQQTLCAQGFLLQVLVLDSLYTPFWMNQAWTGQ